eukprot:629651-Pyramimonas_sp.AAC.1
MRIPSHHHPKPYAHHRDVCFEARRLFQVACQGAPRPPAQSSPTVATMGWNNGRGKGGNGGKYGGNGRPEAWATGSSPGKSHFQGYGIADMMNQFTNVVDSITALGQLSQLGGVLAQTQAQLQA